MSQFSARPMFSSRGGGVPRGEEVASFASYAEAQHAVDSLSDEGFPVQCLTIIGTDLRQVERITGRMSWGRAVAAGAGSGLWIGLFFGAMMSLVGSEAAGGGVSMVTAVLLGVVWGIVFQVGSYALTRGRRDFTSVSQVVASRYSIIASDRAAEATLALADVPGNLSRGGDAARRATGLREALDLRALQNLARKLGRVDEGTLALHLGEVALRDELLHGTPDRDAAHGVFAREFRL